MESWLIPAAPVTVSEEIKKSRFISLLAHTEGLAAVRAFLEKTKQDYPGARHYCWACVAGRPNDSQQLGFSDDGEPAGTAGKPILAQLQGRQIGEVTAVVIRYYGGIKLGTGGLVKAYGGGVQHALDQLSVVRKLARSVYRLECDYALLSSIEQLIKHCDGVITDSEFQVSVRLSIALPDAKQTEFNARLSDLSRGLLHLMPSE